VIWASAGPAGSIAAAAKQVTERAGRRRKRQEPREDVCIEITRGGESAKDAGNCPGE
jgi:hypothetical protein